MAVRSYFRYKERIKIGLYQNKLFLGRCYLNNQPWPSQDDLTENEKFFSQRL